MKRVALRTNLGTSLLLVGLDYHSPGAERPFQVKDHLPSDDEWLDDEQYDSAPAVPPEQGKAWYHTSPYRLNPGDKVIPHGGASPGGDGDWSFYNHERHNTNRPNYVWLSKDLDEAQWWRDAWAGKGSHIYEVHPGDRPQPWNFEGGQGWVAPHATVKREVTASPINLWDRARAREKLKKKRRLQVPDKLSPPGEPEPIETGDTNEELYYWPQVARRTAGPRALRNWERDGPGDPHDTNWMWDEEGGPIEEGDPWPPPAVPEPSAEQKIQNIVNWYGHGSPEHEEAIQQFTPRSQGIAASREFTPQERQHHEQQGWRGPPCEDPTHQGQIGDRCADCGKRVAPEQQAAAVLREAQELLAVYVDDTPWLNAAWDDDDDDDDEEDEQLHHHHKANWDLSAPGLNDYVNWANDAGVLVNEQSAQEYIEDYVLDPETAQGVKDFAAGPGGKSLGAPRSFHMPHLHHRRTQAEYL